MKQANIASHKMYFRASVFLHTSIRMSVKVVPFYTWAEGLRGNIPNTLLLFFTQKSMLFGSFMGQSESVKLFFDR